MSVEHDYQPPGRYPLLDRLAEAEALEQYVTDEEPVDMEPDGNIIHEVGGEERPSDNNDMMLSSTVGRVGGWEVEKTVIIKRRLSPLHFATIPPDEQTGTP